MCGRAYSTYTSEELEIRYRNKSPKRLDELEPNFNMAPTHQVPVLRAEGSERLFERMHWQVIPPWEPEFKTKLSTINAKSETIFESKLYRGAVLRRRCIVPLSGFIEWQAQPEGPKRPFKIHLREEPILSVAGIWERWHAGTPEERHSFAIVTTAANEFMTPLHNRMPVILTPEQEDAWLDPELQDAEKIAKLMKPYASEAMVAEEITPMINSPRNNRPEVLEPVPGSEPYVLRGR